jgi:serine/threonine protein kinase
MPERPPVEPDSESRRPEAPDPLVGKVLAERFRILALVARGGMGKIYKAEQIPLGRVVALKVLAPSERQEEDEAQFRKRFEREASICAKLTHPNTVRVFDFGWTTDGTYFIAMEFIDGQTLHHVIRAEAPLDPGRVVHIMKQVCGSLAEAHKQGIIHRDLKPGNVLLSTQGDDTDYAKVVDFGLVKHVADTEVTRAGHIVGSPMYMAPEQVSGKDGVDHRVDIYALGMMAYVAVTGKRPFDRDTPLGVLMARLSSKPPKMKELAPDVKVPASLEWVVMTCLETDRRDRFGSMGEVQRALRVVEAELRGDPNGPFVMSLDQGRVVLPPEFSDDASLSRSRSQSSIAPPEPPSRSIVRSAGLSLLALGALGVVGIAIVAALVVGMWMGGAGSGASAASTTDVPAVAPATPKAPDVAPEPEPEPEPVKVEPAPEPEPVKAEPAPAPKPKTTKPKTTKPKTTATPPAEPAATEPAPTTTPPPEVKEDKWKVDSDIKNPFGN